MKLKKIASLMLAGVMAVSMLAGCSGKGTGNDNNGQENNGGQATGVSATFASYLSKDNITFSDDSAYQMLLADAVKNVTDANVTNADAPTIVATGEPLTTLDKVLVATKWEKISSAADTAGYIKADNAEEGKNTYYFVYNASDDYDQNVVLRKIASVVDDAFAALPENNIVSSMKPGNTYYTYKYTGSVSSADVSTKNGKDTATYIMVTLTVESTKAEMPKAK